MTSPEPILETAGEPSVVFRSKKKNKTYRQRAQEPEEPTSATDSNPVAAAPPAAPGAPTTIVQENEDEDEGLSVAEAIRRRNARRHRLNGITFRARPFSRPDSNDKDSTPANQNAAEYGLVVRDVEATLRSQQEAAIKGVIASRFAPQTGLVGELVNKNMEEYIESEMAKRKRLAAAAAAQRQDDNNPDDKDGKAVALKFDPTLPAAGVPVESQRVLQGRLMEIDLGEEARARTAAMTERARKRLQGEEIQDEEENDQPRKMRLGPDGKPWRPKNRRGSDDIKRDQLVEEFLHENRLDVYDMPSEQPVLGLEEGDEEEAADDRIADEFRRQFMDAMSQRQRRRKPAINAKPVVKQHTEEILKGPKLGGSRNARAAMRDKLLREQEMKKKR